MYKIIKRYYEPHRFYHNFNHIVRMFDVASEHNLCLTDEQRAAILYHDAYYDPACKENEEKSADLFMDWCFMQKAVTIDAFKVRQIILDTKFEIPTIPESKLIIDLDLYDLGTTRYKENGRLIKKEYSLCCTREQFREGRIKWIEGFLARDSIYVSNIDVFVFYEKQAQLNLKLELEELKND